MKRKKKLIEARRQVVESITEKTHLRGANDTTRALFELYYKMFQHSPVSIWVEDFSKVEQRFENLKKRGIQDFRTYFTKHPEEVISLSKKVKIIEVNETTLEIYQASSSEELFQGLSHVFNKQSYDIFREELIALSEGKTEFCSEAVTKTLKGEERHILLKLTVTPGYEDTLSQVIVSIIDISDLKSKEEELRESEEMYRKIVETANDAIFVVDTETGIIIKANKRAEQLIGMSTNEIVGMHYIQLHSKNESDLYSKILQEHFLYGNAVSENLFVCHKSGEKIPLSMSSSIIEFRGKKLMSCIFRGIIHGNQAKAHVVKIDKYQSKGLLTAQALQKLTKREREILLLIISGFTSKKIAEKLFISGKTVETHRMRMMHKLGIHKTADLVRYAITSGLLDTSLSNPSKQN